MSSSSQTALPLPQPLLLPIDLTNYSSIYIFYILPNIWFCTLLSQDILGKTTPINFLISFYWTNFPYISIFQRLCTVSFPCFRVFVLEVCLDKLILINFSIIFYQTHFPYISLFLVIRNSVISPFLVGPLSIIVLCLLHLFDPRILSGSLS